MKSVGFHPEARAELRESARYYETQQVGLGKHFLVAVRAAKERIECYPLMLQDYREGYPSVPCSSLSLRASLSSPQYPAGDYRCYALAPRARLLETQDRGLAIAEPL